MKQNHWVTGGVRSGKTETLVDFVRQWWTSGSAQMLPGQSILLFAMNSDNRQQVTRRVLAATDGKVPLRSTTPLGFFEDEVRLFWPLVMEQLECNVAVPIRLRPEAEQYLAVQFWGETRLKVLNDIERFSLWRWARNLLDVMQLAAFAGVPCDQISSRLRQRLDFSAPHEVWPQMETMLIQWQRWCLNHGFVTYGLVSDIYWRCLLPLPDYQAQLRRRYASVLADDIESYPAIAGQLFEQCHSLGIDGYYTFNPDFSVRLGLGADPDYMECLRDALQCKVRLLPLMQTDFSQTLFLQVSTEDFGLDKGNDGIEWIETVTRSQLLRQTAQSVIHLVQSGKAQPHEIAIVGPGLDSLARYALIEMIEAHSIPVVSWKEQRPLNGAALVRSLITVLMMVYRGQGRLCCQDDVAEMMVTLCEIDPVRAGLLADYCFQPDSVTPSLIELHHYPRWDRIGSDAAKAYQRLREWIETRQSLRLTLSLIDCLSQAIETFVNKRSLRFDENAVLRELLETAQHFVWVDDAFQSTSNDLEFDIFKAFIAVIRDGTMTANPYPNNSERTGVILATAYQYRISRFSHRYHYWLDVTSPLWQQGSLTQLWGAKAFLQSPASEMDVDKAAIALFRDLSSRVEEKAFLCRSELSTTGHEYIEKM